MLMQELLQVIGKAKSASDLEQALSASLIRFGIDHFELSRFHHRQYVDTPLSQVPRGYAAWKQHQYGITADPVSDFALDHYGPVLWPDIVTSGKSQIALSDYIKTAGTFGVHIVISLPLHMGGNRSSMLHLSSVRRLIKPLEDSYLWSSTAIGYAASARLGEIEHSEYGGSGKIPQLTERERDVLIWSKVGKSYNEIAIIMGISSKTVEFHATNAMRKLNASQKITAVLTAIRLGLIDL